MFIAQKPEVGGATSGMDFSDAPPPYTEQCPPYTETIAEKWPQIYETKRVMNADFVKSDS